MDHPVCDDAFQEALHERRTGQLHQIGGYANCVQGPVEAEIAQGVLGKVPWDSEAGACWTAFLRSLKARGLAGVKLVIADAHLGLRQAVNAVLTGGTTPGTCLIRQMR